MTGRMLPAMRLPKLNPVAKVYLGLFVAWWIVLTVKGVFAHGNTWADTPALFASVMIAHLIFFVPLGLAAWLGSKAADRTNKGWAGLLVGAPLFLAMYLPLNYAAERIPGIGHRIHEVQHL